MIPIKHLLELSDMTDDWTTLEHYPEAAQIHYMIRNLLARRMEEAAGYIKLQEAKRKLPHDQD